MTEKLYLEDSLNLEFEATVVRQSDYQGTPSLLLDRSAFYGEAGGQCGDRGVLHCTDQCLQVVDCQYDKSGALHHLLAQQPGDLAAGLSLHGEVDLSFRRDMMSQHSGQHLLSAALYAELGAETVSSRLGKTTSTVDIDTSPDPKAIDGVVDRVNDLILEDRPIRVLFPDADQLAGLGLRRMPKVTENIRILEVDGFDRTPCGGTHCISTGCIGPVYVTGLERYKGGTRIHFVAGKRCLAFLADRDRQIHELGEQLACGAAGVSESLAAMQRELKQRNEELGRARTMLNELLCDQLHQDHPPTGTQTPIVIVRPEDDLKSLRSLASALVRREDVVALVVGRDPKSGDWRVVLERSANGAFDANGWFRTVGAELGGRGGGRPNRAEGRFPADLDPSRLTIA